MRKAKQRRRAANGISSRLSDRATRLKPMWNMYSTRLSMNNDGTLYQNHSNIMNRAIYIALMGDPTLRQDIIAPPANLVATPGQGTVTLNWAASGDNVAGYHVYRAASASGRFTRL